MALISLGMLFGQRGLGGLRHVALGLVAALGLGLLAAESAGSPDTDLYLLGACLLTALGVARARSLSTGLMAGLAAAIGLLVGLGSNPDGLAGGARWGSLAGTWLGSSLCALWFAVITEAASRPWLKPAVRVVAPWLDASALLVLALTWVGPVRGGKAGDPSATRVQPPARSR